MAHNHPLWLRKVLPDDVRIDVDVTGLSPDGDLKVILAGDGKSFESDDAVRRDLQYTETGYVFIFGGWRNSVSTLVKLQEHEWQRDPSVPRNLTARVVQGKTVHWTISRTCTSPSGNADAACKPRVIDPVYRLMKLTTLAALLLFAAILPGQVPDSKRIELNFTGGYDTDPRDHGRPVVLVAAGLGVAPEVFREAFSHVHPATRTIFK